MKKKQIVPIMPILLRFLCFLLVVDVNGKDKRLLLNDQDGILAQLNALSSRVAAMESLSSQVAAMESRMQTNRGGLVGGSLHTEQGGGTNYLCLPTNPDQGPLSSTLIPQIPTAFAHLYGAEYQFSYKNVKIDDDVPCAVCADYSASMSLMVPGKSSCPKDWRKQYDGLLCTTYFDHPGASDFSCLDTDPQYLAGRRDDHNGKLLYPTISKCGSLECRRMWKALMSAVQFVQNKLRRTKFI